MVQCFVAECDHSYSKNQCSFFRLPNDIKARRKWEQLSGRPPDCTNENSRICSCHFIGGIKSAGPSLFRWDEKKISSDNCVKEEPEETDIMSVKDSPGTPTYDIPLQKTTQEDPTGGMEEQMMKHFKEEETERDVKPPCFNNTLHQEL